MDPPLHRGVRLNEELAKDGEGSSKGCRTGGLRLSFSEKGARWRALVFVPLAALLFSHPALVTFLAEEPFFAEDLLLFRDLLEHVGGGVVDDGFASDRGSHSFV